MVKKHILLAVIFVFASPFLVFSADVFFGGGLSLTSNKSGGFGEVGVSMYKNPAFELRNIISIDGYGNNFNKDLPVGYFGFTEKITFGMSSDYINNNVNVIPYGFVAGNFSFAGSKDNYLFEAPYSYEVYAGFGADIYSMKNMSIFIEAGGGYESFTSSIPHSNQLGSGFARINVGIRGFVRK